MLHSAILWRANKENEAVLFAVNLVVIILYYFVPVSAHFSTIHSTHTSAHTKIIKWFLKFKIN